MLRVCMMTSVHRPFDTRIFVKEARTLAGPGGHEVILIAPHDHDETRDCVRIRAVPRARNRLIRMTGTVLKVLLVALKEGCDIYHLHDPELIPAGLILKVLGKRVIYDAHEHVPRQIRNKHWLPRGTRTLVSWGVALLEKFGAMQMDAVIAAWPAIQERFRGCRAVLVRNYPLTDELANGEGWPTYTERPPWLVYVGAISEIRCADIMVSVMDGLRDRPSVKLRLAGCISPASLECTLSSMPGWDRVDWLGWKSRSEVAELLSHARVGLLLFRPVPNHVDALPNKLFEYMSAGIPVVASDFAGWRKIIEEERCGFLVDPEDPQEVLRVVGQLLDDPVAGRQMGERGRLAVVRRYNWEAEALTLLALYERIERSLG